MSVIVSSFNMGGIHKTITNTQVVMKNTGKRFILEEEEYEFCPELWDIIKSYALYSNESFHKLMFFRSFHIADRISDLCSNWYLLSHMNLDDETERCEDGRLASAVERILQKNMCTRASPAILKPFFAPKNKNAALRVIKKARKYAAKEAKIDLNDKNLVYFDDIDEYLCESARQKRHNQKSYFKNKKDFYEEILKIEQKHSL